MADIYHTFLDDEQEAEYHFRKAHGAEKCAVCGGNGGKWHTDYVPYSNGQTGRRVFEVCEACDGLGLERVNVYTMNSLWGYDPDVLEIFTETSSSRTQYRNSVYHTPVDQHVLMGILQRFAPHAYAAEMRRQGATP